MLTNEFENVSNVQNSIYVKNYLEFIKILKNILLQNDKIVISFDRSFIYFGISKESIAY